MSYTQDTDQRNYDLELLLEMLQEVGEKVDKISAPEQAYAKMANYATATQEYFLVLTLNGSHGVIKLHEVSKGLVNKTMVHPREVFRPAILDNSVAVIVAHNHPSGAMQPSTEDREITGILKRAGETIGIQLLDHLIITKNGFYSFQDHGLI